MRDKINPEFRHPKFFGFAARPSGRLKLFLTALPFVLVLMLYFTVSQIRHAENPGDKILPTFTQMGEAAYKMAFEIDSRTGERLMVADTVSSLRRIVTGMLAASLLGLIIGLNMGLFPGFESLTSVFITFISIIPPLAILPILFIAFGVDEFAKIMLIFIGTFPLICRDIYLTVKKIPVEQITKSLTLGASQLQTTYGIIMPQVIPRLIDTTRLSFGAGWLFLIAAEAIVSDSGLGYRIFLVRRYLAMDIIIPYVFLITFLGFVIDWTLKRLVLWRYSWYIESKA
ncbi:MAG TPA: ABC transporter permease subunit [Spirochaetota bacterium]|nr:ABC transporter permease subunit [Spirochaetota bacterium]HPJ35517.1 ABC transporter permease subunit [Spirochaetota bacterium]